MIEHSTPAEKRYGCESSWDTHILKHILEDRYSITMTRVGIGKMPKRWGFSYTRPTFRRDQFRRNELKWKFFIK